MKPLLTNCPTCQGTGKVELEGALRETLARFTSKSLRLSANDLHEPSSGITKNAMNNRVEKLRRMGLLSRTRAGRVWIYSRADGAPAAQPAAPLANGHEATPALNTQKRSRGIGTAAAAAERAKANASKKGAKPKK